MFEQWQTVFAGLTLIVFAITATIAIVQLRHMRLTYQMANAASVLQGRLSDPAYREELRHVPVDKTRHPEVYVCEYYTLIGAYMKRRVMPREIFFAAGSGDTIRAWQRLRRPVELMREGDSPILYRDFEDLVTMCTNWLAAHPPGR